MPQTQTPICPKCGSVTAWLRSTPADKGMVIHAYECPKCSFIHAAVGPDPVIQAEGWLNGELRPLEK